MVFPPTTENVWKHLEKRVVVFVRGSVKLPMPCWVFIVNVLRGWSAVRTFPSTVIVFIAGDTPRLEGIAQKVPPLPSDVKVVNAGITELVDVNT